MEKSTHKLCKKSNGEARVWLQGKRLKDHGFVKDAPITVRVSEEGSEPHIVIARITALQGKLRKVSGRDDGTPIIDMSGKWVTEFFKGYTHFTARYSDSLITVWRGEW